ncbi:hypothetical protein VNO80_04234 [Phaseolus coccineus]|uniref:Uncharacterized protein n=1 Tax=Phaseolus coccineus TaxID=3886 RepID=A0AAN9NXI7_PHACN
MSQCACFKQTSTDSDCNSSRDPRDDLSSQSECSEQMLRVIGRVNAKSGAITLESLENMEAITVIDVHDEMLQTVTRFEASSNMAKENVAKTKVLSPLQNEKSLPQQIPLGDKNVCNKTFLNVPVQESLRGETTTMDPQCICDKKARRVDVTAPPVTKSTAMTDSEVSKIVAKAIRVAHTTHTTALQCFTAKDKSEASGIQRELRAVHVT